MSVFSAHHGELNLHVFNENRWIESEMSSVMKKVKDHQHLIEHLRNHLAVNIVDFGGSLGSGFFATRLAFKDRIVDNYTVIEVPKICEVGSRMFFDKHLHFTNRISNVKGSNIDLIYCRTALQYVINWKETLKELLELDAEFLMFCHLSAGSIDSFCGYQNYYGHSIPYWFIKMDEFRQICKDHGYQIVEERKCQDIPEEYYDDTIITNRLGYTRDFICRKY